MKTTWKRKQTTPLLTLLLPCALAVLGTAAHGAGPVYNLSSNFSLAANPNGVWSYGWKSNVGGLFNLHTFTRTTSDECSAAIQVRARFSNLPSAIQYYPGPTTGCSDGGQGVFPPGVVLFLPGENGNTDGFSGARFTVPAGGVGRYRLSSSVKNYLNGASSGDTDYHVVVNGVEVFAQQVPANPTAAVTNGAAYTNEFPLGVGGTIELLAGRGLDNNNSGSGLKTVAVVELVDTNESNLAPVIYIQPTNVTVVEGVNAAFAVAAVGPGTLTYQWRFNGTNLAGATNPSLVVAGVQLSNAGNYSVNVANAHGSTNSADAVLTVTPPVCVPPVAGLVSWWRGDGHVFDETGTNNGTLGDNATYGAGRVGAGAFVFDGVNDMVNVGNPTNLRLQNFTIEAWVKRASTTKVTLGAAQSTAEFFGYGLNGYAFGINDDGRMFLTKVGVNNVTLSTAFTDTNFHHVAVAKNGTNTVFYIDGVAYPMAPYNASNYTFTTSAAIGARGDGVNQGNTFLGTIDELAIYNRQLTAAEIQGIYLAGGEGKCALGYAPVITSQPVNQVTVRGSNATFNVGARGSPVLAYQWRHGSNDIAGATNAVLALSNVQYAQAGDYTVVVGNSGGAVTSVVATLTVSAPPSIVRAGTTNSFAGGTVTVPVLLEANGDENAAGFTLNFDAAVLTYTGVTLGGGVPGGSLQVNATQTGLGRLGLGVAMPFGTPFNAGTQVVANVSFAIAPVTNAQVAALTFGDTPTVRLVSDINANTLASAFLAGAVNIAAVDFEGDVSPRPTGNRQLAINDWVQVGRFVAGLDTIASSNEFQRADCAPRSALGNGNITLTDYVQAGRYAVGLDPLTPVGGPTSGGGSFASAAKGGANLGGRTLRLASTTLNPGATTPVQVQLVANGDENALSGSVSFNPLVLTYAGHALGADAAGATLIVNSNQLAAGKVGVVLALPSGNVFAAGTRHVVTLNFAMIPEATGVTPLAFGDQPVGRLFSDPVANELTGAYEGGNATLNGPEPRLSISATLSQVELSWPLTTVGYALEAHTNLTQPTNWLNLGLTPGVIGLSNVISLPAADPVQFFRLKRE